LGFQKKSHKPKNKIEKLKKRKTKNEKRKKLFQQHYFLKTKLN